MKNIYKILFMGSMGVGKTTAIKQLSQTSVVSTEAKNNDLEKFNKSTTTVGLDYGIINLDETVIHLYGSPGQEKFAFVWNTLIQGCDGVLILINNDQIDALEELKIYLDFLKDRKDTLPLTVGIGRCNEQNFNIKPYEKLLEQFSITCPIFLIDVRQKKDCIFLLESLTYQIFD